MISMTEPQSGLERALHNHRLRDVIFDKYRIGFITNFTSATRTYQRGIDALLAAGVNIVTLFSPEHGLDGVAQAGRGGGSTTDKKTGLTVHDIYGLAEEPLDCLLLHSNIDMLVCDLQDVGTRFWTYSSTMIDCLRAAGRVGMPFVVLDRNNPLGTTVVEGPSLVPSFSSFVGRLPIPLRHGLTMGEMARLTLRIDRLQGRPTTELHVLPGPDGHSGFTGESTLWLPPSPNLATIGTARVYPGMGLLEGTNCSEGRGTTHPFEMFGAPWADYKLAMRLNDLKLPGVLIREASFVPSFSKYSGKVCHGAYLHITDPDSFEPVHTGLAVLSVLRTCYPDDFMVLPAADGERHPTLDRLWGSDRLRTCLATGGNPLSLGYQSTHNPHDCYPADIFVDYPSRSYWREKE